MHPYQFERLALAKSGMRVVFTHRAEIVRREHYVFVPMPYLIHDDVAQALCEAGAVVDPRVAAAAHTEPLF